STSGRRLRARQRTRKRATASRTCSAGARGRRRRSEAMAAENKPAWVSAFEARTDLDGYGSAALGLFALALRYNLEDLETVAAESLTEGGNDKKCDIVYIDRDDRIAVIAQTYVRPANAKPKSAAPANKASDLNAAVNWLLIS